jgi:hypothetical protein
MSLDFGEVALGQSITARLLFQGNNLNAPINVQIYRDNSEMFFVDNGKATTIAANLANSEDGYWLPVVYTPTEIGEHTSRLLISGGGVSASRGVALIAKCLPVPELSACTATAPTDITDNSYVANWTVPQDEVVDYFIVTRTMYKNGVATSEELQAETNELLIEDFDLYDSESYSVQSVRLGYRSPMSNTVYVSRSGVQGVTVDTPFAILNLDGAVRFICSTPHTGVRIFDTTGRCIKYIDSVDNNTDILLPQGIYVITSDQCHRPVKAIVR